MDTIKTVSLPAGTVIPANSGIIYNSTTPEVTFTPTTKAADAMSSSTIKGAYCDSIMPERTVIRGYYEFRNGNRGLGFYLADGKRIEGGTGFVYLTGSSNNPLADSYVLGPWLNPGFVTGVTELDQDKAEDDGAIYNLQGVRLNEIPKSGVYIINKKKYIAK